MTKQDSSERSDAGVLDRRTFLQATCGLGAVAGIAGCNDRWSTTDTEEGPGCTQPGGVGNPPSTKTRRTIYTDDRIRNARSNIEQYDWARAERDSVVSKADAFLDAYTMDDIWHLVTGQQVPRASAVDAERRVGSPTHGAEIYPEYGRYPWEIDELEAPWKLTDPMSGMTYPTNDFASYLESGRDERGFFDPERADDQYLVNETYPDRGETWGVDDGYGWVDDDGKRFTFVAYYNHFAIWSSRQSRWGLSLMTEVLGKSYLFTGDPKYARAAAIILARIADEYPNMTLEPYQTEDGYANSHGGTGQGKVMGSEWETRLTSRLLGAYDAIFPAIAEDDWIQTFLSEKASSYDLPSKSSPEEIRRHLETRIFRQIRPAVERAQIRGNFGTHQAVLAKSAVVLDDPDGYTAETLDFVFRGGGLTSTDCGWRIEGGNVLPRLVGVIDRDGHNNEGAPNYNQLALNRVREIADVLDGYDGYDGGDLYRNLKVERMHAGQPPLVVLNRYEPSIGDSGRTGRPGPGWLEKQTMVDAYDRYGDPEYAQLAYLMNGRSIDGIHRSLFEAEPDGIRSEIADVIEAEGPLDLPSQTLAGFGFTALRDGSPEDDTQRALWLYYGRNSGHAHQDTLHLGIAAHGLVLAPDFGYPAQTGPWPKRMNWTANTISHNTVLVDERRHEYQWVAEPRHFDGTERVDLVDVEAPDAYPGTDTYRRTTTMIRIDSSSSYAVDFFRVDGGDDHHFSFHGAEGEVSTAGLDLVEQQSGTYAGPDVPKPGKGENTEYNTAGDHTAWGGRRFNNGFNYLYDVSRDGSPPDRFSVDWAVEDTWDALTEDADVHLRLTMLGETDEVAVASGDPPDNANNPDSLRYLLAHRSGTDLSSTFTSVIEPYEETREVTSVDSVPVEGGRGDARAVRVRLASGRTDYVVSTTDPGGTYSVGGVFELSGVFGVYSERDGTPEYAYLQDGDRLRVNGVALISQQPGRITGSVTNFTREIDHETELVVDVSDAQLEDWSALEGEWIYVDTDGDRNGAYRIEGVQSVDGGRLTLSLGSQTLVSGLLDPESTSSGYEYIVSVGDAFTIPRGASWSRTE